MIPLYNPVLEFAKDLFADGGRNKKKLTFQNCFLLDGDDVNYNGYEGQWSIKTSNQEQPDIFNMQKEIVEKNDGTFYSGVYVDAIVQLWYQNNQFGKRVNARLKAVRFRAQGEKLNSQTRAHKSMFDDIAELDDMDVDAE